MEFNKETGCSRQNYNKFIVVILFETNFEDRLTTKSSRGLDERTRETKRSQ